jgi:hypothetical protein
VTLTDELEGLLAKHLARLETPPSLNVLMQAALRGYLGGLARRRGAGATASASFVSEDAATYDAGPQGTIELDDETERTLRQAAIREGTTTSALAAQVLREYVRGLGRPAPRGIGAYRSGRSDVSSHAEELLWPKARKARR